MIYFGWFCFSCVCISMVILLITMLLDAVHRFNEWMYIRADNAVRHDVSRSLTTWRYWFSESSETAEGIDIAVQLMSGGQVDIIRDEWRKRRKIDKLKDIHSVSICMSDSAVTWYPKRSAPKDRYFISYYTEADGWHYQIAKWLPNGKHFYNCYGCEVSFDRWTELPLPPVIISNQQEQTDSDAKDA